VGFLDVGLQATEKVFVGLAIGLNRYAGWFIDHQKVVVFEEDGERQEEF